MFSKKIDRQAASVIKSEANELTLISRDFDMNFVQNELGIPLINI